MSNRTQYPARKVTPETSLKRTVKQYLGFKGYYVFSILQSLGALRGIVDQIAIRDGETLYLEIKTPNGRQSEHQVFFQRMIEEHGGKYYVIRSVEDLEGILLERVNVKAENIHFNRGFRKGGNLKEKNK